MSAAAPGQSILIVDDDAVLRDLICKGLRNAGYAVLEAPEGASAIACLEKNAVDVLLTDIIMPDREGVETIIEVRERWPSIDVIAMSGGGKINPERTLDWATQFGAHAVLRKPFKLRDLLTILEDRARLRDVQSSRR